MLLQVKSHYQTMVMSKNLYVVLTLQVANVVSDLTNSLSEFAASYGVEQHDLMVDKLRDLASDDVVRCIVSFFVSDWTL